MDVDEVLKAASIFGIVIVLLLFLAGVLDGYAKAQHRKTVTKLYDRFKRALFHSTYTVLSYRVKEIDDVVKNQSLATAESKLDEIGQYSDILNAQTSLQIHCQSIRDDIELNRNDAKLVTELRKELDSWSASLEKVDEALSQIKGLEKFNNTGMRPLSM